MSSPRQHDGCAQCGISTSDGLVLCQGCQTTVKVGVGHVATYHAELFGLGAQRVRTRRAGGVADPTGLAVSASEATEADAPDIAAMETRACLVGWVRVLVLDRPQVVMPRDTVEALAAVLAKRTSTIATLPWAGDYARDVLGLERRLRRIVARGKGSWYAGTCGAEIEPERVHDAGSCACACHLIADAIGRTPGPAACNVPGGCNPEEQVIAAELCTRDLYAQSGDTFVRCSSCHSMYRVSDRRAVLLAEARDALLPISVIAAAAVTLLGEEPSVARLEARLRQWAKRHPDRLRSYGTKVIGGQQRPVYAMGEVLDLLMAEASRGSSR